MDGGSPSTRRAAKRTISTPDGQRFLVNSITEETSSTPITLVLNWTPKP
jgi:hypothetical protein